MSMLLDIVQVPPPSVDSVVQNTAEERTQARRRNFPIFCTGTTPRYAKAQTMVIVVTDFFCEERCNVCLQPRKICSHLIKFNFQLIANPWKSWRLWPSSIQIVHWPITSNIEFQVYWQPSKLFTLRSKAAIQPKIHFCKFVCDRLEVQSFSD